MEKNRTWRESEWGARSLRLLWSLALIATGCAGASGHAGPDDSGAGRSSVAGMPGLNGVSGDAAAPVAGASASGGDADEGDVASGEYWIGLPVDIAGSSVHVRITSSTEARVWTQLWGERSYSIERSPGVDVSEERLDSGLVLRGAFVLRELGSASQTVSHLLSIAVSEGEAGHFGKIAKLLYIPQDTFYKLQSFAPTTATGRVRPDSDPTNVAIGSPPVDSLPIAPWSRFSLLTSKPAAEPFSQDVRASVGDGDVEVAWDFSDVTGSFGHFPGWPSLIGATVQFSGEVQSTNGIASPLAAGTALTMLHFGPTRTGSIDLQSPDLETWGSELHAADQLCVNGCLQLTSNGGLALRLPPSVTKLVIRYRTYHFPLTGAPLPPATPLIAMAATAGPPTATVLPESDPAFVDAVVSLPNSLSDTFVTLTVPMGTFSGVGEVTRTTEKWFVFIESITLTES